MQGIVQADTCGDTAGMAGHLDRLKYSNQILGPDNITVLAAILTEQALVIKRIYSQLPLKQTPSGRAQTVLLREVSVL